MYRCKHFKLQELVDRATFEKEGEEAWSNFQERALIALDGLWEFFSRHLGHPPTVTVNNWLWGGPFQLRGYRPPSCTIGAAKSEHKNGNAFDCDIKGLAAAQARQIILDHKDDPLLAGIMRMEADVTWLHFDCKDVADRIRVFKP